MKTLVLFCLSVALVLAGTAVVVMEMAPPASASDSAGLQRTNAKAVLYVDPESGCQYFWSQGIYPRLAADGVTVMGCKDAKPPARVVEGSLE